MRLIRGPINAILVATLMKPMTRWMIARWRRRAREYAEETFVMPAQELFETTIAPHLVAAEATEQVVEADIAEVIEELGGRSTRRTLLIIAAIAAAATAAVIIVAEIRRRREAAALADAKEAVTIPIDASGETADAELELDELAVEA